MKGRTKVICSYAITILMAILLAADYHFFIVDNHFAPAGLGGIATMIQFKTGFSISYVQLIINIPLCIIAFIILDKRYAIRSLVFVLVYSFSYLFFQHYGFDFLKYNAHDHNTIFPAIISGVISGFVTGICLQYNSSTGGMDIIAKYINKISPNINFFFANFILNATVAISSLFVYSNKGLTDYEPVALCITYCFTTSLVGDYIIKGSKTAYKFTVITTHADEICDEIMRVLHHSATRIPAKGAYTNNNKSVLICVINKHQIPNFKRIIERFDDTFSFYELVNETYGNFKRIKTY